MVHPREVRPRDIGEYSLEELLAEVQLRVPPVPRQPYPLEMFNFLNVYRPAPVLELVFLRDTDEGICVLLKDRLPSDVGYAGECHAPGGFLFNEESIPEAIRRIAEREIGVSDGIRRAALSGVLNDPVTERGHELHLVFLVSLLPGVAIPLDKHTRWVPVADLPSNIMATHWSIIDMAHTVHIGDRPPAFVMDLSDR